MCNRGVLLIHATKNYKSWNGIARVSNKLIEIVIQILKVVTMILKINVDF